MKPSDLKDTLFVGNLPVEWSQDQVTESIKLLCKAITAEFTLILKTGPPPQFRSRGFCFVTFQSHPHAEACKRILAKSFINVRLKSKIMF